MLKFLDREDELARLDELAGRRAGGLAVVHGRRRLGKTRLLLEWSARHGGCYCVADQSAPDVQRRYLAEALATRLAGFAEVEYPTWEALLARLARDATAARWCGPVILDELPYLVTVSPELPSVLQRFVDGSGRRLALAVAGSSQRMMQGIVLSAEAPLYGRASVVLDLGPIAPRHLAPALDLRTAVETVEAWTAWGGVPRYWELAAQQPGPTARRLERLALDPLGPLHREPDRLLLEELPPATEVRPLLDAIGGGAHRVSEMAGRIGRPATSLSRPLDRLVRLGLVEREVPYGEPARSSRRSLYRIADPFFRLWFRVVAPHRGPLAVGPPRARLALLERAWPGLVGAGWEELCRRAVSRLPAAVLAGHGPFAPAGRWWRANEAKWDVVSTSLDGQALLLGEARWVRAPVRGGELARLARELRARPAPDLGPRRPPRELRVLFLPRLAETARAPEPGVTVVTAEAVVEAA